MVVGGWFSRRSKTLRGAQQRRAGGNRSPARLLPITSE
jgi:hypothetical protein